MSRSAEYSACRACSVGHDEPTGMKLIFQQMASMVAALLLATVQNTAAGFANLHDFSADATNGGALWAGMVLSGRTLYGTAGTGGRNGYGIVFKLNVDGTGFTNLWDFGLTDGSSPQAALVLSSNTLYGTTYFGGSENNGTVFAINTNGTGFTNLHSFPATHYNPIGALTNKDGACPFGALVLSSNTLYGTTAVGGAGASGTIFKIKTDGTGFTDLHSFALTSFNSSIGNYGAYTNSDGGGSSAGLVLSSNTLYGTTSAGGTGGSGTVFKINTDGTGFTNLYHFTASRFSGSVSTNIEGMWPTDLVLSDGTLYGTAGGGGDGGSGTLFRINTDGTDFTNFHNFGFPVSGTNGEGTNPHDVVLSGSTLYGVTFNGGIGGEGTVFAVNTNGTGFTTLYSFTPLGLSGATNVDGVNPRSALVVSRNVLYGTAFLGGNYGWGTVFSLTLPPPTLDMQLSGGFGVLRWSDPAFLLQAARTVNSAFTNIPDATSPYTNAFAGPQMFFRLQLE